MKDALQGSKEKLHRQLASPFPDDLVQQKRKGGATIDFVPYTYYVARLNELEPLGWSCEVGHVEVVPSGPNEARLLMTVSVRLQGRTYTGTGVADAGKDKDDWGGAHAECFSQAFRRACAQMGMGLYMYHGEDVTTFPEQEVDDGDTGNDSDGDVAGGGGGSGSDDSGSGVDGARPGVVVDDRGEGEGDSEVGKPTEKQMTRIRQLHATGVFEKKDLDRWKKMIQEKNTKGRAGRVLREMKEKYEEIEGEPFDPETS